MAGQRQRDRHPRHAAARERSASAGASAVHATDGEIGKVEGLVVEPAHGHVTHVLLQEGHLWGRKEVAIPIGAVEQHRRRHHGQPDEARDRGPACRRRRRPELLAAPARFESDQRASRNSRMERMGDATSEA